MFILVFHVPKKPHQVQMLDLRQHLDLTSKLCRQIPTMYVLPHENFFLIWLLQVTPCSKYVQQFLCWRNIHLQTLVALFTAMMDPSLSFALYTVPKLPNPILFSSLKFEVALQISWSENCSCHDFVWLLSPLCLDILLLVLLTDDILETAGGNWKPS